MHFVFKAFLIQMINYPPPPMALGSGGAGGCCSTAGNSSGGAQHPLQKNNLSDIFNVYHYASCTKLSHSRQPQMTLFFFFFFNRSQGPATHPLPHPTPSIQQTNKQTKCQMDWICVPWPDQGTQILIWLSASFETNQPHPLIFALWYLIAKPKL